jgi:acetyl esterase/lipase
MIGKSHDVIFTSGIEYGTHGAAALFGDLYVPDAPGPHPALICAHGGGWDQGSRASYAEWGQYLARRGYVVFAADRRRFPANQAAYPGVINDLQAAIRYMRWNAARLGIDPERIALMGDSSGGYVAALTGLVGDDDFARDHEDGPYASASCAVKAVIAVYGVFDLAAEWAFEQVARPFDRVAEKLIGVPLIDDRVRYFRASPVAYATRDRNKVAFLLSWGTNDEVVSEKLHSRPFAALLGQANFDVQTVIVPHAQHYWVSDPISDERSHSGFLAPRLLRFLEQHL